MLLLLLVAQVEMVPFQCDRALGSQREDLWLHPNLQCKQWAMETDFLVPPSRITMTIHCVTMGEMAQTVHFFLEASDMYLCSLFKEISEIRIKKNLGLCPICL